MDKTAFAGNVRDACIQAALAAYEQAGIQGLCEEGRFEAAVGAMQAIDVNALAAKWRDPETHD
jgi:hypothetical protein